MSSGCGDVLSLADLQNAKKHQIFEAEVITGKSGGVATGADIDFATNQVTGQTQKTLPAVLRDAGFNPASFTFETGGVLGVNDADLAVLWPGPSGDGNYYVWKGALPKTIPASSTPASTGGVGQTAWVAVSEAALRNDLAATTGATLVKVANGNTVQQEFDMVNAKTYVPEDFGCDSAAVDNTAAVISALTSGKNVKWSADKTYNVTGIVTASQDVWDLHTGVMKLNTSRYSLGVVTVSFEDKVQDSEKLRIMYVESAYDLCELAFIKNLGINTIKHYGNFAASAADSAGSVQKVLDNARALGMRVIASTEVGEAGLTTAQFIQKYRYHPALLGWATFDEAMSRGITYTDQKTRYDLIRQYSNKPVVIVDAWYGSDVISNLLLEYYDIVLADPYSVRQGTGSLDVRIANDLNRMRRSYGGMQAHSRNKKVIPVLGMFTSSSGAGTDDIAQITGAAEVFRNAGNGEFAVFVWDGAGDPAITAGVRATTQFRSFVSATAEKKYPVPYVTESFIFGGNSVTGHQPLNSIIDRIVQKDLSTTDTFQGKNAYPVQLISGGSDTDRAILTPGWNVSGIGFKGTSALLVTNIPFRANLLAFGEYNTTLANLNGNFTLFGSYDGGYTILQRGNQAVSGSSALIEQYVTTPNPNERLCIGTSATIDSALYRRFWKGLIVSTDW